MVEARWYPVFTLFSDGFGWIWLYSVRFYILKTRFRGLLCFEPMHTVVSVSGCDYKLIIEKQQNLLRVKQTFLLCFRSFVGLSKCDVLANFFFENILLKME